MYHFTVADIFLLSWFKRKKAKKIRLILKCQHLRKNIALLNFRKFLKRNDLQFANIHLLNVIPLFSVFLLVFFLFFFNWPHNLPDHIVYMFPPLALFGLLQTNDSSTCNVSCPDCLTVACGPDLEPLPPFYLTPMQNPPGKLTYCEITSFFKKKNPSMNLRKNNALLYVSC